MTIVAFPSNGTRCLRSKLQLGRTILCKYYFPEGTPGYSPWSGVLSIAPGRQPASGDASSPETAGVMFTVPSDICSNVAYRCYTLYCIMYVVTSTGTVSQPVLLPMAMKCGPCTNSECQMLIQSCSPSPFQGSWSGFFKGICGGTCPHPQISGRWAFQISSDGSITGSVEGSPISGVVDNRGAAFARNSSGSTWIGHFGDNFGPGPVDGHWSDPTCPCSGTFSGLRTQ
jgi:hypothetical protein